jgi:hypothetical protein
MISFELDFPVFKVTFLGRFQAIRLQLGQQHSATFISDIHTISFYIKCLERMAPDSGRGASIRVAPNTRFKSR